jgi:N6-L-threonylcarbamoyladenine synthase
MNKGVFRVKKVILGIDTSNYRTSLCLVDLEGKIVAEERQLLSIKAGGLGLQQSEAVFQHINRLPKLAQDLKFNNSQVVAVAVSTRPRPAEGSYMPVFKAGESWARGISLFLQVPLIETTHQEMHIAAGEYSADERCQENRFLSVHLSGGTSELLLCTRTEDGYSIECLGGTRDLHAGQLIDRIGVALGLPFPAGPYLEELAREIQPTDDAWRVPSTTRGFDFHFSGAETQLLQAIKNSAFRPAVIARAVEQCIANTLDKVIRYAVEQGYPKEVLIVGGVAANTYIKDRLNKRLMHPAVGCRLYYADPHFSGDNAYGVAIIGLKKWNKTNDI